MLVEIFVQESVVLSTCRILSTCGLKCRNVKEFKENGLFQCKKSFCIHNEDV